jgi:ABC-type Fe3+/spermidine/putrescine transport system ATPase subunit
MNLEVRGLRKQLGGTTVLRDVGLQVGASERFFLLGPSGSGKTTLLRILAGFLEPDAGDLLLDGRSILSLPAHQRPMALVFQQPALWPHLTVGDNLGYGLDVRGITGAERRRRIAEALALVRLEGFEGRQPTELSGGQQQRVALARALVIRPGMLLLDEPLSHLDPPLRRGLREELVGIQEALQIPMICVSHDRQDALSIAQRMAVLNAGTIAQDGPPSDLFLRPGNPFVADFLGEMNWWTGRITCREAERIQVESNIGTLWSSSGISSGIGAAVRIGIRPRHLNPLLTGPNRLPGTVLMTTGAGEHDESVIQLTSETRLRWHHLSGPDAMRAGDPVTLGVAPEHVLLFPAD